MPGRAIVIMGVSGCGKTTVGQALAQAMGWQFLEGDTLHTPRSVALMAAGTPLTDDDRSGWLDAVASRLSVAPDPGLVVSCSALKRSYRDRLRGAAPDLQLIHLHGDPALLAQRMASRQGHYMPASLLRSQLDTLEMPAADEQPLTFDIAEPLAKVVGAIRQRMSEVDSFTKVILFTDADGRARFRDESLPLAEGKPMARLSPLMPSAGYQLRRSPVGFRSEFHCTENPQWVFILGGEMEIGLQDGSSRIFKPGEHFYSADVLPAGASFDPKVHGHWSRQCGGDPLLTLFVRG